MEKGDRVRIILKTNGYNYNGEIINLSEKEIIILDKIGEEVTINRDIIAIIEVKK